MKFSNYIVYVDESGDHGLSAINLDYPVFVLAFCIFKKEVYSSTIVPSVTSLKFKAFGHDMAVLHEHDIRKRSGPFKAFNERQREKFLSLLSDIIERSDFSLVAIAIDKLKLRDKYPEPENPYNLAMSMGLERIFHYLNEKGESSLLTHVVFESRGPREDSELELEFRRVCDGRNECGKSLPFEIVFADKKSNSVGLQFSDMTARPIGLSILRPDQPNRAMDILRTKFRRSQDGMISGYGLKVFP
ncbi:MAG: DUF3800 domain-containing protein [Candidatus Hydrogenedentes bacterium]|nr:DUF3800 domain-containing protein [Candidatus Hydrogenedentota bacterium]